ncbi:MAG: stage III sporulation protein AA [Lachnospiraceae bacterium]|nr:stage III sporulation protein AA [Lachnospiraceae bacterium]
MDKQKEILRVLSLSLRKYFKGIILDFDKLQEIRLRSGKSLIMLCDNREILCKDYIVSSDDLRETVEYICNYSVYAYEEELRQGFVTIQGGHRVGFGGKVVCENERIKSIKNISFLNIRLAHEVIGCADSVIPYIYENGSLKHTLIISPPGCGKTTLLRDIVRSVSNGNEYGSGMTVGVVDERSEIAACYMGIPQNDVGLRTDVLDCCPKAQGMLILIRSMSPKVLAVDEIGDDKDIEAIRYVYGCGCKVIVTAHGTDLEDIKRKPFLREMVNDELWERYIVLDNNGHVGNIAAIYDKKGIRLR